ncbi:hypothetical protein [Kribbella sp. VKM Ac-2571]|uniref:hypothetical protein n=1 Tax=Kribbella sp. VKM Ac-2571 TaxID=2512222 RepID=UPI0014150C3B|nr:hypothetical protein [Kribbella sp. VKM Ac-2571]
MYFYWSSTNSATYSPTVGSRRIHHGADVGWGRSSSERRSYVVCRRTARCTR